MATAYTLLYNRRNLDGLLPGVGLEPPKTTTEKWTNMGTEQIVLKAPIKTYNAVEIEAETEAAAAEYARVFLGANKAEGELRIATTANLKSISPE